MAKSRKPRAGEADKTSADAGIRGRRLWLFRMIAILLVPALTLGILEVALRVAGYGYPASYFVKSRIDDRDFLIPNYKFGYRFFPPALTRKSPQYRIPAEKPEGVFRIFVMGESAALGIPDWSYGVSRYLDILLEQRYPNIDFEVICVAVTAINSHAILPIARECADLEGDLWVIYMGNNEMVGPFGACTIFGAKAPGLEFVRANLALKKTRVGQLMAALISKIGSSSDMPDRWTGIDMFTQNLLRHNDPKRNRAYRNFEDNLRDILKAGEQAGVPIILSTVGSNIKDCSPFASLHREGLDAAGRHEWDRLFREGSALEKRRDYEEALARYEDAAAIDSEYAELHYRMGTCYLAQGLTGQARQAFVKARDYDALVVRADSRINQILKDTESGSEGRVFRVDAENELAAQSSESIPGKDLFYEHVHLTVDGNFTLARIIADQVQSMLPGDTLESQTDSWLDSEACHRRLALTLWDQMRLWSDEAKRVNVPPFTSQSSNPANRGYVNRRFMGFKSRLTAETWKQDNQLYLSALDRVPEDTFLIENYSDFLNGTGKRVEAIRQAERFCALLPDFAWGHCWLAALLMEEGRMEEARQSLEKALQVERNFALARELLKRIN